MILFIGLSASFLDARKTKIPFPAGKGRQDARSKSVLRLIGDYGMTNSPWSEAEGGLRVKRAAGFLAHGSTRRGRLPGFPVT